MFFGSRWKRTDITNGIYLLSNISIGILACVLVYVLLTHPQQSHTSDLDVLKVGTQMPPIRNVKWSDHKMTLLVAIRKGCHYCEASMPFYKQLSLDQASHRLHAFVLCVAPDPTDDAKGLLQTNRVALPVVGDTELSTIYVTGTPTLLLVDNSGKLVRSWIGQLTQPLQTEVVDILRGSTNPRGRSLWSLVTGA